MLVRDWVETRSDTSKVWGNLRTLQQLTTRDADTDRARAASGKDGRSLESLCNRTSEAKPVGPHASLRFDSYSEPKFGFGRTWSHLSRWSTYGFLSAAPPEAAAVTQST